MVDLELRQPKFQTRATVLELISIATVEAAEVDKYIQNPFLRRFVHATLVLSFCDILVVRVGIVIS